ncbi:MAG TPA: leucine--tRNA ligase [Candidatus Acidoferrales bacterium]|nr:leucine--tRNA ligase [Candidatus Acidoferrales bacterium]
MAKIKANSQREKRNSYNTSSIELKWQAKWEKEGIYQPDLDAANQVDDSSSKKMSAGSPVSGSKRKNDEAGSVSSEAGKNSVTGTSKGGPFYNLMMFPYPSAEGLHVGSIYTFGGIDVYGRFKRMRGYQVFEPIGLDGFGIHSENHAIKTNTHPIEHAERTEKNFYRQLHAIGNSYAWKNKVETYDPDYYRWTQWIFVQLFKSGLAYKKNSPVNFCPSCKTVLSDEQVIDGACERCNSVVEKRDLEQWFFNITRYAERLLANIEHLNWTEKVRLAQRNWIGKKEGINITYEIDNFHETVTIFTTRPDTNFGATFIALAPEQELVKKILNGTITTDTQIVKKIKTYVDKAMNKSEIERQAEGKEKTGVFTGLYATNPLTGYQMPVWVSDFVLGGFGTGALVGVPGHDKRDFEFATKFGLEIIRVVVGKDGDISPITKIEQVQEDEGTMINSGFLNGMDIHKALVKIMDYIEEKGYGCRVVTYHLRDWLISRQRYWGPPIPMIHCEVCAAKGDSWFTTKEAKGNKMNDEKAMAGWYPEENLPVKLPYIKNFKPLGTGKAPLANHPEFYETNCPRCGGKAIRETDVSDTFLDSSWYFLRYLATDWKDIPFPSEKYILEHSEKSENQKVRKSDGQTIRYSEYSEKVKSRSRWLPVTSYIGGAEHSVLHLLYARFITMALKDMGYVDFEEPFSRFYAHGLIIKDGAKMSKSKGNIINPDDYIHKYGADTLRTYLLFLGPFDQGGDFRDSGIDGMSRFLKRVWRLLEGVTQNYAFSENPLSPAALQMMHQTIKGITEDLENLRFNTAIAKLMTYYNFLSKQQGLHRDEVEVYLKLLAPFAPHMTEELWAEMGNQFSIHTSDWPTYDEKYLKQESVTIAVQVNGKLRGTVTVSVSDNDNKAMLEKMAREDEHVAKFLEGTVKKVILVPGKILNFVV